MQSPPLHGVIGPNDDSALQHPRYESAFFRLTGLLWALISVSAVLSLTGCGEDTPLFAPRARAVELTRADIDHAQKLVRDYGCVACHTVPGVKGPDSKVGPPLDKMALRGYIGGVLPNTPDNLVQWLLDPPAIDPRTAMPNMGMSDEDAKNIATYLLTFN